MNSAASKPALPEGVPALLAPIAGRLIAVSSLVPVVTLADAFALLPLTLSVSQVSDWTGLKKTKLQELINLGAIATSKVDGRTLCLTGSVIALIERNRVERTR